MALPWSLFTFRSNLYIHSFCSTLSIWLGVSWACWFFPGFFMESSIFKSHLLLYPVFCRGGNYRIKNCSSTVSCCVLREESSRRSAFESYSVTSSFLHRNFREKKEGSFMLSRMFSCTASSVKKTFCRYKKIITIHLFHTAPSKNVYSLDDRSFQIYLVCNKRFTRSPGMIFLYLTCTVGSPPLWQREFLYRWLTIVFF